MIPELISVHNKILYKNIPHNTALYSNDLNIVKYFTSFSGTCAFLLLINKNNKILKKLFLDMRYFYLYSKKLKKYKDIEVIKIDSNNALLKLIKQILISNRIEKLKFIDEKVKYNDYISLKKRYRKFKPEIIKDFFKEIMAIKTEEEKRIILRNQQLAKKILYETVRLIENGKKIKEKELKKILILKTLERGYDLSFDPIVLSGKNTAYPHGEAGNEIVEKNKILLIDYGIKYKEYCSDITRMFYINKADKKLKKAYKVIKKAKIESAKALKTNVKIGTVLKIYEKIIKQNNFEINIRHSLGHSLGYEVHQYPYLNKTFSQLKLKKNMVFTVEPGLYLEGIGGVRDEDIYFI